MLSSTFQDLLLTRRTYDKGSLQAYSTHYFIRNIGHKESQLLDAFSFHIITVEMPTLGKDLLRALTTGRFTNTSHFCNSKQSELPKFMYECFIHIFHKDGYLRENHDDIAALRQVLMMYYKYELPFTEEQELIAHQKFVDLDKSVKIDSFPSTLHRVRDNFLSCLPDDPFDIRPHHSNGATNTSGVDNSIKRSLVRYKPSLFGLYRSYFPNTGVVCDVSSATFNSKLTVVPKDSRGPRTICMEPHEHMFIQKGIMHKIYDHVENFSPARGFINFTDQRVNQNLAYSASIDASWATIDLKDASDMVSWPLITSILSGTDWFQALDVTRSKYVTTLCGTHRLQKYAPMGAALCFPIEAILFWSISKTVCPQVYVYGDDIIVPSRFANDVMSALESYGLTINRDKSLTTGFFKESCGGDYFHGRDIGIVQCKSLDFVSYIEFVNLLGSKFGNNELCELLVKNFESTYNHYFPRTSSSDILPGFFKSRNTYLNDIFLRKRYNNDLQRVELRVLMPDTVEICNPDLTDDDLYRDWLNTSTSCTSLLEDRMVRAERIVLNQRYDTFFDITFSGENLLVKKREKLKFTWTPLYSFMDRGADF
jgi:hypothetical protein